MSQVYFRFYFLTLACNSIIPHPRQSVPDSPSPAWRGGWGVRLRKEVIIPLMFGARVIHHEIKQLYLKQRHRFENAHWLANR